MPESCRALEWISYGSNVYNAFVPFYANISRTPDYMSCTPKEVSTESFYWVNRMIAAMADPFFNLTGQVIARYQFAVQSKGWAEINRTDALVLENQWCYEDATPALDQANDDIAAMLRQETEQYLDKILYTASCGMRNSFSLSDY